MSEKLLCALCECEYEPQEKSHIIPAFVHKWIKDSSATGVLRLGSQMNRRVQDGLKDYFLCRECEDRFSKFETAFSKKIFHPYVRGSSQSVSYEDYFLKFVVSVSWRVLAYGQQRLGLGHFRGRHKEGLASTLQTWKDYLLARRPDVGTHRIHVVPMAGVVEHTVEEVPSNINRYLRRSTDIDVVVSDESAFTYVNLASLLVIGIIVFPRENEWENTEVLKEGCFTQGVFRAPGIILHHLMSRCQRLAHLENTISPNQLDVIEGSFERNRQRAESSQTRDAAILDILLSERSRRSS